MRTEISSRNPSLRIGLAFALLALAPLAVAADCPAERQVRRLGPGREADVAALLGLGDGPAPVLAGVPLGDVALEAQAIRAALDGGGLVLLPAGTVAAAPRSASFDLVPLAPSTPVGALATAALAARVAAADQGAFWEVGCEDSHRVAAPGPPPPPEPLARIARRVAYGLDQGLVVLALLLLLVGARGLPAWWRGLSRAERVGLLLALGAGLLARLVWAPHAPLHENYVGYRRVECAATPGCAAVTGNYGPAPFALYHLAFALLPAGTDTAILLTSLLGAATIAVVFAMTRRVIGPGVAPIAAAGLLAIWPTHVRLSASEDFGIAGMLLVLGAALALGRTLEDGRARHAPLAVALGALALQHNVAMLPVVLAAPFLVLAVPKGARLAALRRPGPLLAVGGTLVALAPFAIDLAARPNLGAAGSYASVLPWDVAADFLGNAILLDPEYTPVVLALLALAGLPVLLARAPGRAAFPLVLLLVASAVFDTCDRGDVMFPTRLRCQGPLVPLYALAAGAALAGLVRGLGAAVRRWGRSGRIATAAATSALVTGLVVAIPDADRFVRASYVLQDEYAALRALLAEVPDARWIVFAGWEQPDLPATVRRGDSLGTWFPLTLWRRAHPGSAATLVGAADFLAGRPPVGEEAPARAEDALLWCGATFFTYLPEDLEAYPDPPAERPLLTALRGRFQLVPVAERALPVRTRSEIRYRLTRPSLTVGFYRLRELDPRARRP